MARKSKIVANQRRRHTVARYSALRAQWKDAARTAPSVHARKAAQAALARLPRDASPVRVRNRDAVDGRPRGYLRVAGISRVRFRTMAHNGELPGITKASW